MKKYIFILIPIIAMLYGCTQPGTPVTEKHIPEKQYVEPTEQQKKWALATAAVLTEQNRRSHDLLGGCERTPQNIEDWRQSLRKWWGINSREDLLESLKWIENGGHRQAFEQMRSELATLTPQEREALKVQYAANLEMKSSIEIIEEYGETFGEKSLLGWDYARYVSLCGWGYVIGYITEEEAWKKIMPVARMLQATFDSWEDLGWNYVIGRRFWSYAQTLRTGEANLAAYQKLSTDPTSPWKSLAWDLNLETPYPDSGDTKTESPHTSRAEERNAIDPAQSHPETVRNVIDSAQAWLELVDNQQYMESWEETTDYFKSTTTRQNWQEFMSTRRKLGGKTLSRELLFEENTTSIPGAPDGKYVVMSYATSFEHKKPAIETITSVLDKDNTWRVSGYHLYFPQRNPEAERKAIDSVQAWLELMDNQQYPESWEETAEFFKSGVSRQNWQEMMSMLRTPMGKTLSRELIFQEYTTSIPGAPDGEYVIIHYKTLFENNTSARETIRSRLDNDNRWRVVGYYLN